MTTTKSKRVRTVRRASHIASALAAAAVLCAAFSPVAAEAVAIAGVAVDFGARFAVRFFPTNG